jgi:hypothetical protein
MKGVLTRGANRSKRNVELGARGEIRRSVEGEDFECKQSDFEINAMINW